jgi:septal ring factor EnvC (AmiA/AmiB activator)
MEHIDIVALLGWISAVIGSMASWFAGKHKRESDILTQTSDSIKSMQDTIDLLVDKNKTLVQEITALNDKIVQLNRIITDMKNERQQLEERMSENDPC